ncbi:MAG: BolA family transcriptional regulator [Proteobacteria bacterium]|nr:BolA family transcriptional regulator [Pseudomonadota bacterium]MBI3496838.1 BolA family transcriptional regulator [Pseudomonadota bacterium]
MAAVADRLRRKIKENLDPKQLEIIDESDQHAGHAGARPGGETHFRMTVVASAFAGKSRVERQRLVYAILKEELAGPVHALSLTTVTPEEAGNRGERS